jgi:hypothetical protein
MQQHGTLRRSNQNMHNVSANQAISHHRRTPFQPRDHLIRAILVRRHPGLAFQIASCPSWPGMAWDQQRTTPHAHAEPVVFSFPDDAPKTSNLCASVPNSHTLPHFHLHNPRGTDTPFISRRSCAIYLFSFSLRIIMRQATLRDAER